MKAKAIQKLLKGVIDNLCETITDESIVKIIKEESFISGGCIPTMLLDGFVNDFDFYFTSKEAADKVSNYFKNISVDYKKKYHVKLITENAINLSDKVQLITKFCGDPKDVVEKFDWKHIKSYYQYSDKLNLTDDVYRLIVEKELIYTGSDYPLSSLMRLKKYIKNGWNVSNATIVHIALDFHNAMNRMQDIRTAKEVVEQDEPDRTSLAEDIIYTHNSDEPVKYSVEDIIYHMNGVDPLTIQAKLVEQTGKYLSIEEIVSLLY